MLDVSAAASDRGVNARRAEDERLVTPRPYYAAALLRRDFAAALLDQLGQLVLTPDQDIQRNDVGLLGLRFAALALRCLRGLDLALALAALLLTGHCTVLLLAERVNAPSSG